MNTEQPTNPLITSRRTLLKGLVGVGMSTLIAPSILIPQFVKANELSNAITPKEIEKALTFYNIHTGEHLKKCVFWAEGKFIPEGQAEIKKLFRDFRTGEQLDMDPDLLTLLHKLSVELETTEPFHLISGYRSPKTNAALRKKSKRVAHKSQHPLGKAADISVPGRCLKKIQALAKNLKMGGVGRYSGFVHVDTGRIRYW